MGLAFQRSGPTEAKRREGSPGLRITEEVSGSLGFRGLEFRVYGFRV